MSDFDSDKAHQFLSAHCFNSALELIDKPEWTIEIRHRDIHPHGPVDFGISIAH